MGFVASDSGGGGDFKRVPPGVFIARCFGLIDLGTQRVEFQGDIKLQHKMLVKWELFGEDDEGKPLEVEFEGKTMPMTISKRYTVSLNEKARLRQDLASWRGKDFSDEEAKGFDVSKLVGAYCMLNVSQSETNGKIYSNVAAITPLPGALKNAKPAPVHANQVFDLDNPNLEMLAGFHEKLQETIKASMEWSQIGKKAGKPNYAAAGFGAGSDDDQENPPF